ncbi:MAG: GNAT family N-acetyltransferase [Dehalococcoidia bacterium]|nr:GNAT family N-acetyltransferase [Dehalococcoidia bacterium]
MQISLRAVTGDDIAPMYAIHREALRDAVEATWGSWDDAVQEPFFREHWDPAVRQAVLCDGRLAGFIDVSDDGGEVELENIEVAAAFRRQGIGSGLIRGLQGRGRAVRLQVLKLNPGARRLYDRLGFEPTSETETHIQMRWLPAIAERRMTAYLDGPDEPDIPNPIHSTEVATEYGFKAALVGGVTVYGWCIPPIAAAMGERWIDAGWADVRFRRPVYPGDELTIRVTRPAAGEYAFSLANEAGERCIVGSLGYGAAPWLGELDTPVRREAEARPAVLPVLTPENIPVGQDLRPMLHEVTPGLMAEYVENKIRDEDPRWKGEPGRIHPAWIVTQLTPLFHHSYDYGPSIHTRTQVQHLAPAFTGQRVTFAGRVHDTFERHGDHYAVIDGLMLGQRGEELARVRHTTIFQVARRR